MSQDVTPDDPARFGHRRPAPLPGYCVLHSCPVRRHGTRIDGYPPEHHRLEPPVLILASPEPRARSCRGIVRGLFGDQLGTAYRA